jgi:hypothetical protein
MMGNKKKKTSIKKSLLLAAQYHVSCATNPEQLQEAMRWLNLISACDFAGKLPAGKIKKNGGK